MLVPYQFWNITHSWDDGRILVRVGPDGNVEDWIPLKLPHRALILSLERCLSTTKFTPAITDGKAVPCDVRLDVPLRGAGGYGVMNQTIVDHIESMQASMGANPDSLILSSADQLDTPLKLLERGNPYLAVDDEGNLLGGTVRIEFYIDTEGKPRMLRVLDQPNPIMANAAFETVSGFRFNPPKVNGDPTVVKVRIPVVLASK